MSQNNYQREETQLSTDRAAPDTTTPEKPATQPPQPQDDPAVQNNKEEPQAQAAEAPAEKQKEEIKKIGNFIVGK